MLKLSFMDHGDYLVCDDYVRFKLISMYGACWTATHVSATSHD